MLTEPQLLDYFSGLSATDLILESTLPGGVVYSWIYSRGGFSTDDHANADCIRVIRPERQIVQLDPDCADSAVLTKIAEED